MLGVVTTGGAALGPLPGGLGTVVGTGSVVDVVDEVVELGGAEVVVVLNVVVVLDVDVVEDVVVVVGGGAEPQK